MVADWGCRWKRVNGDDPASGPHAVNERIGQYELLARRQFDLAGEFQRLGVHGVSVHGRRSDLLRILPLQNRQVIRGGGYLCFLPRPLPLGFRLRQGSSAEATGGMAGTAPPSMRAASVTRGRAGC